MPCAAFLVAGIFNGTGFAGVGGDWVDRARAASGSASTGFGAAALTGLAAPCTCPAAVGLVMTCLAVDLLLGVCFLAAAFAVATFAGAGFLLGRGFVALLPECATCQAARISGFSRPRPATEKPALRAQARRSEVDGVAIGIGTFYPKRSEHDARSGFRWDAVTEFSGGELAFIIPPAGVTAIGAMLTLWARTC